MAKSIAEPRIRTLSRDRAQDSLSDDILMALAAAGRTEAFELLIRRHERALRRYCSRMCGDATGDEVAQEVFLAVWTGRHDYEPRGRFRSYLFTIAERRARNAIRSRMRRCRYEEVAEDAAVDTPMDSLLASEQKARIEGWLERLSTEQRSALLLHYAGGLEYEEIAAMARRPSSTIRARVFAGLARLRRLFKDGGRT